MNMYRHWINAILGLIVLAVAFMDLSAATLTWTLTIAGIIIVGNSFWGATASGGRGKMRHSV